MQRWLGVGGCSWHAAPRARAERGKALAGAVTLLSVRADHNQGGMARAHSKLECCASSETASAGARALHETRGAGLALEAAAGTWHHGRAPKERGLLPTPCLPIGHGSTTTSAARREQPAASLSAVPMAAACVWNADPKRVRHASTHPFSKKSDTSRSQFGRSSAFFRRRYTPRTPTDRLVDLSGCLRTTVVYCHRPAARPCGPSEGQRRAARCALRAARWTFVVVHQVRLLRVLMRFRLNYGITNFRGFGSMW